MKLARALKKVNKNGHTSLRVKVSQGINRQLGLHNDTTYIQVVHGHCDPDNNWAFIRYLFNGIDQGWHWIRCKDVHDFTVLNEDSPREEITEA